MNMFRKNFHTADDLSDLTTYQVGMLEASAHRAIRQHKDSLLRSYGLSGVDWYIIGAVADAGIEGIRTTDLAQLVGTTAGFLTKTTTLLEAKRFLYKTANKKDARSSFICFNEEKRGVINEIEMALRVKLRESLYGSISSDDLLTYIKVLQKFVDLK